MKNIILLLAIAFICNSCTKQTPLLTLPKLAVANGNTDDTNIRYFGRWDNFTSYWGGAYIKVNFTGTTAKIKVGNTSNFYAKIDTGPWISYNNAGGTIDLTSTPLASGMHSLSVAQGGNYDYLFKFEGLILDAGATTAEPSVLADLIEYIGDSITAGYLADQTDVSDYAWVCSENLHTEHTQIAYPGIKLVNGMDAQYYKLQTPNYTASPAWDFTKYTPRIVVINLGTNDDPQTVNDNTFQQTYITLLTNIRAKFPSADIFVMRTFLGLWATPSAAAVSARNAAGDTKVHYIDTQGWITQGTSDYLPDNLHPSVSGHIKIANLLQPILASYLTGTPVIANGTYKIVNRNSSLVIDAAAQGTTTGTAIQQWTDNGGDNQRWTITNLGDNQYKITGVQSGKSVDVSGQSVLDGAPVQLGDNNQRWVITPVSGGYYFITNVQSGKVMEVPAQSTAAGATIAQYTNNGGNHQQWSFR